MTISVQQARALCTSAELNLFEASRPPQLKTLSLARLQNLMERARKHRDKYRDLHKQQRRKLRSKVGSKGNLEEANRRTDKKATLFTETLERLQKQQTRLKAAQKESDRKAKAAAAKAKTKAKAAAKSKARPKTKSKVASKSKASPAPKSATSSKVAAKTKAAAKAKPARQAKPESDRKAKAAPSAKTKSKAAARRPKSKEVQELSTPGAMINAGGPDMEQSNPALQHTSTFQKHTGFIAKTAMDADIQHRDQKTRTKTLMSHQRAAGKRAQARRDSRN